MSKEKIIDKFDMTPQLDHTKLCCCDSRDKP